MAKLTSIAQASSTAAALTPREITLRDGTIVKLRKLSWLRFTELWEKLGELITALIGLGAQEGGLMTYQGGEVVMDPDGQPIRDEAGAVIRRQPGEQMFDPNGQPMKCGLTANDIQATLKDRIFNLPEVAVELANASIEGDPGVAIADWDYDEVILVCTKAVTINFVESTALLDFIQSVRSAGGGGVSQAAKG